jgi:5-methylcytosine-specific restriction endonuclease McrA
MNTIEKISEILRGNIKHKKRFGVKDKIIKRKVVDEAIIQRHSDEYKKWRKEVFNRDKYRCQKCGRVGVRINVHHILGFKKYKKYRFDMRNSITLCLRCHRKFHKIYGKTNFPNIIKVWNIENKDNKYL